MKYIRNLAGKLFGLPSIVYWIGVYAVVSVISYFSLLPMPFTAIGVSQGDKFNFSYLHLIAYFCLSFVLGLALKSSGKFKKDSYFYAIEFSFIFSFAIELIQNFVPGRYFGLDDILINLTGILLAQGLRKYLHAKD